MEIPFVLRWMGGVKKNYMWHFRPSAMNVGNRTYKANAWNALSPDA
jgi:hypothetical protein